MHFMPMPPTCRATTFRSMAGRTTPMARPWRMRSAPQLDHCRRLPRRLSHRPVLAHSPIQRLPAVRLTCTQEATILTHLLLVNWTRGYSIRRSITTSSICGAKSQSAAPVADVAAKFWKRLVGESLCRQEFPNKVAPPRRSHQKKYHKKEHLCFGRGTIQLCGAKMLTNHHRIPTRRGPPIDAVSVSS